MIKLSVIIPTFNRCKVLLRTLDALFAQDLSPDDCEIIVVLDGATDGTAEALRSLKPKCAFRAHEVPHGGPSAARNTGIRMAVGELVLFLDDDLFCTPELFRVHCEAHSDSELRVVHGPIYIAPGSSETIVRYVLEQFCEGYYRSLNPEKVLSYPGEIRSSIAVLSSLANSSVPRELLLRCGGFDEEIRAAEDLELGLRLWKMGADFHFKPTATAHEYYTKTSWEYLTWQATTLAAGDLRACRKHSEYRPYSLVSSLAEARAGKSWLRSLAMRFPVSPVPLLALPLLQEKRFYRFPIFRKAGARLFGIAERVMRLRSALAACGSWKALESEFGRKLPSLMYHNIGPSRPGTFPALTVSPEQFEQQVRWLARHGYVGIAPSDWMRWLHDGTGLPKKPILLTFDDAYADTARYAFPILRRYGFSAGVFVVTKQIGGTNTWDEAQGSATLQLMTAEQIRYWAAHGIEFGAHSRTHSDLTRLSAEECAAEIEGSKNDLADLLDSHIASFCYPYGEYNDAVREVVRKHFDLAFSTEEGLNYLSGDPHLLRRAYVGPDDPLLGFALGVRLGGLQSLRDLRARFGVRSRLRKAMRVLFSQGEE